MCTAECDQGNVLLLHALTEALLGGSMPRGLCTCRPQRCLSHDQAHCPMELLTCPDVVGTCRECGDRVVGGCSSVRSQAAQTHV